MLSCSSCVQLCAVLWAAARLAPLSMGILQERILEWVACPPPGDLPKPGIETVPLTSTVLADRFFTTSASWRAPM